MKKNHTPTLTPKKKKTRRQHVNLTLDPEIVEQVALRGDVRSEIISQDLGRYYRLLADARMRLREQFTPKELGAIIDTQNGYWYHPRLEASEIWANVEDGCRLNGLAQKWGIDGAVLVQKLQSLDLLAVHALADATTRFWHAVGQGDERREPKGVLD